MKRTSKQRILVFFMATTLAAALGAACGQLIGSAIILRVAKSGLQNYVLHMNDLFETYLNESHTVLLQANQSAFPYCSDEEIAYFRKLLQNSGYMRDAGRMRDGGIECSALMGRLTSALQIPSSLDSQQNQGDYRIFALPQANNLKGIGVQLGNSFVVFNNFIMAHLGSNPVHYSTTVPDLPSGQAGPLRGEAPNVDHQLLTRDGIFRIKDDLYVTRCSTHSSNCGTAYISISKALQAEKKQIGLDTLLGCLVGGIFGFLCSFAYRGSLGMERQLLRSIRRDELRVAYQPIVDLATGRVVEAEALVRWSDEDDLEISPEGFVRIAEERGFVGELTELVVRHVLNDFSETLRSHPEFRININVTASDLADARFLPMLQRSLNDAEVAAQSIAIEVTESSTARKQEAVKTIRQLRERGHSVQIDDFGTGYSSLAYLKDLSVDAIKIDRAFTQAIGTDAVTVGILPQILSMAKALNLQVIAEGIETVEQAAYFAGSEMPILGQGWLFGRPVPAESFLQMLAEAELHASAILLNNDGSIEV